jgi:hypothetical protein
MQMNFTTSDSPADEDWKASRRMEHHRTEETRTVIVDLNDDISAQGNDDVFCFSFSSETYKTAPLKRKTSKDELNQKRLSLQLRVFSKL